ncbi:hypothetical protein RWE15_16735 [Virgibacillus halophilus]|uniref:Cytochrome oxidase subunit II transmembrane region profile domain-containing protein n=1 Tax=Tigheibacillus halophilus TaxID=361280 RepID=A0ABU5C8W7_9BACI|nr:hypothetical protein [Virgibacillus halophilus]
MVETIWSLVPPLLAILMVLLTKRVLLSLGVGIIAAALFTASFNPEHTLSLIWNAFKGVFVEDGGLNTWNVYILLFCSAVRHFDSVRFHDGGERKRSVTG